MLPLGSTLKLMYRRLIKPAHKLEPELSMGRVDPRVGLVGVTIFVDSGGSGPTFFT